MWYRRGASFITHVKSFAGTVASEFIHPDEPWTRLKYSKSVRLKSFAGRAVASFGQRKQNY